MWPSGPSRSNCPTDLAEAATPVALRPHGRGSSRFASVGLAPGCLCCSSLSSVMMAGSLLVSSSQNLSHLRPPVRTEDCLVPPLRREPLPRPACCTGGAGRADGLSPLGVPARRMAGTYGQRRPSRLGEGWLVSERTIVRSLLYKRVVAGALLEQPVVNPCPEAMSAAINNSRHSKYCSK